jgi:hypothetical protein
MKTILIILAQLCVSIITFGQTHCDNDVSTDYLHPTNNALPQDLVYPTGDSRYLNGTNWYPLTPGGNLEDYDLSNMMWSGIPLLEMDNIWSNQTIPYYNYVSSSPKPLIQNGWELLLINLGRYPNDVDVFTSNESFQALPYIVIYNRYTGLMRVFANFGLDNLVGEGADAVEITLEFLDDGLVRKTSGLLRLYEGYDKSLDQTTTAFKSISLAKATNTARQWFSADFQLTYDPCTCFYPSKLQLSFNQIKEENIDLHGRSLTVTDNLINSQLQIDPMEFLSSLDYSVGSQNDKDGILIYKGLQTLVNDFDARYEKYKLDLNNIGEQNEIVEQNLGALKMLKYTLTAVITFGANPNFIDVAPVQGTQWYQTVKARYGEFIRTADGYFNIPNILSIIKKVAGGETKTYIEQNFERHPLPNEPDANRVPAVTYGEMVFKGTISDREVKGGPNFYTPGTYGSDATKVPNLSTPDPNDKIDPILTTMYEYPVYNEVLGTFALLKKPKVGLAKALVPSSVHSESKQIWTGGNLYQVHYKTWTKKYALTVSSSEIKYALNSVLDIDKHNIKVGLRYKAKTKYIHTNGQQVNTFINPDYTSNVVSTTHDVDSYDRVISCSNTDFTGTVNDGWYSGAIPFVPERIIKFQTVFVPLNALSSVGFKMGYTQEYYSFGQNPEFLFETTQGVDLEFFDIEVVFMVEMEFETLNDKGEKNTNFQIFTYQIPNSQVFSGGFGSTSSFDMRPENENLIFRNTNFDGFNVIGCVKNGQNYTCQAWNDITIEGAINISNGYFVDFVAGNEIVNKLNSVVPNESVLRIEPILNVKDFCGKVGQPSAYLANIAGKGVSTNTIISDQFIEKDELSKMSEFSFVIYPNPTDGYTRIKFSNSKENVKVQFFDFTGREIEIGIQAYDDFFDLDATNLNPGVYTVILTHLGISKTKKLIIN